MGVGALPVICRELVAHGMPADTPAAIVERATLPDERCITATVASLPQLAAQQQVRTPALSSSAPSSGCGRCWRRAGTRSSRSRRPAPEMR